MERRSKLRTLRIAAYVGWLLLTGLSGERAVVLAAGASSVDDRPRIVAFGDSLTAGLGVAADETYPAELQRRLDALGLRYRVINAGVSGETTAGGLRRVPWILRSKPEIVILELGANDGLRGLRVEETKANLERIIQQLQQSGTQVILAGMKLPPNYGHDYLSAFERLYPDLATRYRLPLIPFFLEGVAASNTLNQADGIHPTAHGYRAIVEMMLGRLQPVLKGREKMRNGAKQ
ncbi:Esterase TesA [Nitrospira lenta]|uniref:Esterase TesA n=1 Tax=Nitrospira lenta TaxID=1436998 RepID=A0A330L3M8_9BACT|nr:Esterase TesA [Nitrospira lenta]